MSIPIVSDDLVSRIARSDDSAFAELYRKYFVYLCVSATAFIHDNKAAEEIVNDLFLDIWRLRSNLRSPIHPYIMKGLKNRCIDYLRSNRKTSSQELLDFRILNLMEEEPVDYDDLAIEADSIRSISSSLPSRCRHIFHLYFEQGLSTAEISSELKIASSTVRVQLKIALDKIRRSLNIHTK